MIRAIGYHFKTAIKNIMRHFTGTMIALTGVTFVLVLIGLSLVGSLNMGEITTGIMRNIKIQALIDTTVKAEEIGLLQQKIESIDGVYKVVYRTKHEELESFIKSSPGKEDAYIQYRGEDNPMRDSFYIELKDQNKIFSSENNSRKQVLQNVRDQIKDLKGIVDVEYGGPTVEKFVELLTNLKYIGYIFAGVLSIVSIFLIQNTIRSTIYARAEEISIMRNVGANNWFIKFPFIIEGVILGLLGSILPSVIILLTYPALYAVVEPIKIVSLIPTTPFIYYIILTIALVGMGVGVLGSWISANKYLRFKR